MKKNGVCLKEILWKEKWVLVAVLSLFVLQGYMDNVGMTDAIDDGHNPLVLLGCSSYDVRAMCYDGWNQYHKCLGYEGQQLPDHCYEEESK